MRDGNDRRRLHYRFVCSLLQSLSAKVADAGRRLSHRRAIMYTAYNAFLRAETDYDRICDFLFYLCSCTSIPD